MKPASVFQLIRPVTIALALAVAAAASHACGGAARSANTPGSDQGSGPLAPAGQDDNDVFPCTVEEAALCMEHAIMVTEGLDGLIELQNARDLRSIPAARAAMSGSDALLQLEGLRLIGPFADQPGVEEAVTPFLVSPRPALRQMAAHILLRSPNRSDLGAQYQKGHAADGVWDPYEPDPPRDLSLWGHAAFPGALPYPPGDSASSLGLSTASPVEEVTAFYEQRFGKKRTTMAEYKAANTQATMNQVQQVTELMKEYQRTHDPKVFERMQLLSGSANKVELPPLPSELKLMAANMVIMEGAKDRPPRMAIVYREPVIDRTVAVLTWDPTAHPEPLPAAAPISDRNADRR
jgi:hypothetical protein